MIFKSPSIARCARSTLICAFISSIGALSSLCPAATVNTPFVWGAVGHNEYNSYDKTAPYSVIPITTQMNLLTSSGMSWYRDNCQTISCPQLISAAAASGVTIFKSTGLLPDATLDEAGNYAAAYLFATTGGHNQEFTYFEAGNELDNWVGFNGTGSGDGSTRSQYNASRYLQARGFVRGMIDGLHAVNPGSKVAVDNAGWCHYGFQQMLWQDGVQWDITAVHWYSNEGNIEHAGCKGVNVASMLAAFGLPIWITEYNANIKGGNDPALTAAWLSAFITQIKTIAPKYNIQAAFVYELLDESNFTSNNGNWGMFHGDGSPKIAIGSMIRSNPVNLASAANVNAIFGDGSTVTNGGIDTYGNAFSASRLGTSVTSGGLIFTFQGAGAPNAVSSATVALPAGRFSTLNFLATAVRGNQTNQTFTVTYTDGTTSTGVQSFSDWYTPQNYTGETVALPMSSRLLSDGAPDNRLFNLYGYSLPVNPAKTVQSVTLPNNRNVVVLAVTLAR